MIDGGSSALYAFFVIILLSMIISIFYYNITLLERFSKTRYVNVKPRGKTCNEDIGSLPEIPTNQCEIGIDSYYYYRPPSNYDLEFILSTNPTFYLNVCRGLCDLVTSQGQCQRGDTINPEIYEYCLNLLEPPPECKNGAIALGYLEGTNTKYYAKEIKTTSCVNL